MDVRLGVALAEGEGKGADAEWMVLLLEELESLDEVELSSEKGERPAQSKGLGFEALIARIPYSAIPKLVGVLRAFVTRTGRTVEASIEGDLIKITGASREQQDRVIEAWLARHPANS